MLLPDPGEVPSHPDVAGKEVRLPEYLPADTVAITNWEEALEALRSPKLWQEPTIIPDLNRGSFPFLDGLEHHVRRRVFNPLVRPAAVDKYRDDVMPPIIERVMRETLDQSRLEGQYATDLLLLLHRIVVEFIAALIGLDGVHGHGRDELRRLFNLMQLGGGAKWLTRDRQEIIDQALRAMDEYRQAFFEPSYETCQARAAEAGSAAKDEAAEESTVLRLMTGDADFLCDDGLALRQTISFLIAGIHTSTQNATHAVDELHHWFASHPEDYELRLDPGFLAGAIMESIRLHANAPLLGRIATEDLQLASGKEIRRGQRVAVFHRRANRSKAVFGEDADAFDPRRHHRLEGVAPYGLAFGSGSHMFIGLKVVLGRDGSDGTSVKLLQALFKAGVEPDPAQRPTRFETYNDYFTSYPVLFTKWGRQ